MLERKGKMEKDRETERVDTEVRTKLAQIRTTKKN